MRIGLLSDSHDNLPRLQAAIEVFAREEVEALLHMGDLSSASALRPLNGWAAWVAQGNTDMDPAGIASAARACRPTVHYGEAHDVTLGGVRFGLVHGDDLDRLEGMVGSGAFDVVCHGHTHAFRDERLGRTRVVNPGALHRTQEPSVCTYDTGVRRLERFLL